MTTNNQQELTQLFTELTAEGQVSPAAAHIFTTNATIGQRIRAGRSVGNQVDRVRASRATLLKIYLDDSGSIAGARIQQPLADGVNGMVDAMKTGRNAKGILASLEFFSKGPLYTYQSLDSTIPVVAEGVGVNYVPNVGRTPLRDVVVSGIGGLLVETKPFRDVNVPVTNILFIATDGRDEGSVATESEVQETIRSFRDASEMNIIAAYGIGAYDFRTVFQRWGIDDRWIMTSGSDPKDIRAALGNASESLQQASQAINPTNLGSFAL